MCACSYLCPFHSRLGKKKVLVYITFAWKNRPSYPVPIFFFFSNSYKIAAKYSKWGINSTVITSVLNNFWSVVQKRIWDQISRVNDFYFLQKNWPGKWCKPRLFFFWPNLSLNIFFQIYIMYIFFILFRRLISSSSMVYT